MMNNGRQNHYFLLFTRVSISDKVTLEMHSRLMWPWSWTANCLSWT